MDALQELMSGVPMDVVTRLIAGALGGAAAGAFLKAFSMGRFWNMTGGLLGALLLAPVLIHLGMAPPAGTALEEVARQAVSGFVGGAVVLILIGLLKNVARN